MEAEGFLVTRVIDGGVGMSLNTFKSAINVMQFGDRRESKTLFSRGRSNIFQVSFL